MIGTIHVCVGCDHPDRAKRVEELAGVDLLRRIEALVREADLGDALQVKSYACVGNCESRCRMSVGGPGRWSWLFGDLVPEDLPAELATFFQRWVQAEDGFLLKDARPGKVRKHLIGRVPPD